MKHTNRNRFLIRACPIRCLLLAFSRTAHTGILFISPTKRSDFCTASRTGLLWLGVNSSRIRYENRYFPMLLIRYSVNGSSESFSRIFRIYCCLGVTDMLHACSMCEPGLITAFIIFILKSMAFPAI